MIAKRISACLIVLMFYVVLNADGFKNKCEGETQVEGVTVSSVVEYNAGRCNTAVRDYKMTLTFPGTGEVVSWTGQETGWTINMQMLGCCTI